VLYNRFDGDARFFYFMDRVGENVSASATSSLRGKASFVETSHDESPSPGSRNCYCKTMKISSGVRRAARLVETVGTTGARRSREYFGE
jgi:hypothetical protein